MLILDQKILFPVNYQTSFHLIFEEMKSTLNCEYLLYSVISKDDCGQFYTTNEDWQRTYINENLIKDCVLVNFGAEYMNNHHKPIILPWHSLHPRNKAEKRVLDARNSYQIGNGISLGQEFSGFKEFLGITGHLNDTNFVHNAILNIDLIRMYLKSFRSIAITNLVLQNKIPFEKMALTKSEFINTSQINPLIFSEDKLIPYLSYNKLIYH